MSFLYSGSNILDLGRKRRGVVSLSGGLDSSTLLAAYEEHIVACVFFNYGSKQNKRELISAKKIAAYYKKPLYVIDCSNMFCHFNSALLQNSNENVELGRYGTKETCNAKVPFRNGIFASFLVGFAESRDLDTIFLGIHGGDHRIYADCTPVFAAAFSNLVYAYNKDIFVETPFLNYAKKAIANIALAKGLPVDLTYSCYIGEDKPCGKCPTCIERIDALGLFGNFEV